MDNNVKKKDNKMLIIVVGLIVLALLLFALWFFVLKGENKKENTTNTNNTNTENETKDVEPKKGEYDYTKGVLHTVDGSSKFVIKGVMLVGKEREELGYMDKYAEETGFKTKDLKTKFELGEWINIYLDTEFVANEDEARIYITPHKTIEEHQQLDIEGLNSNALEAGGFFFVYRQTDYRNFNFAGNGLVEKGSQPGTYDILFTLEGKILYYIVIDVE